MHALLVTGALAGAVAMATYIPNWRKLRSTLKNESSGPGYGYYDGVVTVSVRIYATTVS